MCWTWLLVVLLWGCTGSLGQSGGPGTAPPQAVQSDGASERGLERAAESADDIRELSRLELIEGPAAQELGVSKLLRRVGVLDLLENYLINIPPSADFLLRSELFVSATANRHFYADADAVDKAMFAFENRMRNSGWAAAGSMPDATSSSVLDEAFFEAFERCGRESAWPDVELYELHDGRVFDVLPERVEPEFGISQFDYLQLRHECARYAATYPTLDPEVRDRLLAPQRAHFARVILDRLDNELPLVEIPPEYQDEIDDLRANGW